MVGSPRTRHFVLPKQWASMRKAEALERETGRRVIHLEKGDFQGEEFLPAPHILDACARSLRDGEVRYVPGPGLPELRDAIAAEMTSRGRLTAREEVLVTMGAKHALTQTLLTLIGEGDSVVFPNPGYPPDEFWVTYAGGHVLYAPLTEPDFAWDLAALEALLAEHGPRLLILNTPQRPNGMIVANLAEISELCLRYGTLVLSDEIFSHRVYTPSEHKSITALPGMAEQSIAVDTFSKTYIMTGFRIGWSVANPELCTLLDIFQQNSVTNVPAFVQQAALAALTGPQDQVEHTTKLLRAKRDKVVDALNQMPGVTCAPPDGSFYIFPDIQRTGLSAQEASDFLTEQFSVATVAGTAFGSLGEGHIRITYACPDEMLDEGIDRLGQAFDAIEAGRAG